MSVDQQHLHVRHPRGDGGRQRLGVAQLAAAPWTAQARSKAGGATSCSIRMSQYRGKTGLS